MIILSHDPPHLLSRICLLYLVLSNIYWNIPEHSEFPFVAVRVFSSSYYILYVPEHSVQMLVYIRDKLSNLAPQLNLKQYTLFKS